MSDFGKIIKHARHQKKMELKDVQDNTGIDYTLVSRLEKGERLPSKEQVFHLSDFYGIDREKLLIAWQSDKILSIMKDYDINMIDDVFKHVLLKLRKPKK